MIENIIIATVSIILGIVLLLYFKWELSPKHIHTLVVKEMDKDFAGDPIYERWKAEGGFERNFALHMERERRIKD